MIRKLSQVSRGCFEGDEGGEGGDKGGGEGGVKFTPEQQAKVDAIVASDRKKWQGQAKEAHDALEAMKDTAKMTAEEKTAHQTQLATLKSQYTTEAERAAEAHQGQVSTLNTALDVSNKATGAWQNRYANSLSETQLMTAAVAAGAFNPQLVVGLLGPKAQLTQQHDDDGVAIEAWDIKIPMAKTDSKGVSKDVLLTPDEAVKLMVETPDKFGSLFKTTAKGGTGGNNNHGGGGGDFSISSPEGVALLRSDPDAWAKKYKEEMAPGPVAVK